MGVANAAYPRPTKHPGSKVHLQIVVKGARWPLVTAPDSFFYGRGSIFQPYDHRHLIDQRPFGLFFDAKGDRIGLASWRDQSNVCVHPIKDGCT